ncbi:hypothetical protein [Roseateles amylovorans]|uniref:Uncharacterized protein n=1 Tax=Roseateles amylovorans TaxID=2978473 RepID=A0ABY6B3P1_9BURK|nr:hypothetical protein [Roseateles amylovorans]UXH79809.1 hypothetical protein N4261_07950 [Roseateles amylovorans]
MFFPPSSSSFSAAAFHHTTAALDTTVTAHDEAPSWHGPQASHTKPPNDASSALTESTAPASGPTSFTSSSQAMTMLQTRPGPPTPRLIALLQPAVSPPCQPWTTLRPATIPPQLQPRLAPDVVPSGNATSRTSTLTTLKRRYADELQRTPQDFIRRAHHLHPELTIQELADCAGQSERCVARILAAMTPAVTDHNLLLKKVPPRQFTSFQSHMRQLMKEQPNLSVSELTALSGCAKPTAKACHSRSQPITPALRAIAQAFPLQKGESSLNRGCRIFAAHPELKKVDVERICGHLLGHTRAALIEMGKRLAEQEAADRTSGHDPYGVFPGSLESRSCRTQATAARPLPVVIDLTRSSPGDESTDAGEASPTKRTRPATQDLEPWPATGTSAFRPVGWHAGAASCPARPECVRDHSTTRERAPDAEGPAPMRPGASHDVDVLRGRSCRDVPWSLEQAIECVRVLPLLDPYFPRHLIQTGPDARNRIAQLRPRPEVAIEFAAGGAPVLHFADGCVEPLTTSPEGWAHALSVVLPSDAWNQLTIRLNHWAKPPCATWADLLSKALDGFRVQAQASADMAFV